MRPFLLSQAWGVGSVIVTIFRCRACCPNISRRSPVSVPVVLTSTLAPGFGAGPAGEEAAVSPAANGTIAYARAQSFICTVREKSHWVTMAVPPGSSTRWRLGPAYTVVRVSAPSATYRDTTFHCCGFDGSGGLGAALGAGTAALGAGAGGLGFTGGFGFCAAMPADPMTATISHAATMRRGRILHMTRILPGGSLTPNRGGTSLAFANARQEGMWNSRSSEKDSRRSS